MKATQSRVCRHRTTTFVVVLVVLCVCAFLGCGRMWCSAAETATVSKDSADIPAFVTASAKQGYRMEPGFAGLLLYADAASNLSAATVRSVVPSAQADIVILKSRNSSALRPGVRLEIFSANTGSSSAHSTSDASVLRGEVILVAVNAEHAAALVLKVEDKAVFQPGDSAVPKLLAL